jgi:chromosome segregation ATPase
MDKTMTKDATIESPPATAVAEYTPIAAALAAARARYQDVVWDLTTTRGNEDARRARRELVSLRTGLEARRKELKAPLLAQAKLVDDEAKRITAELLQLEEPIDALIRADERRREDERAAREAAELARVAGIQAKIKAIMAQPIKVVRIRSAALLQTAIDNLAAQEIDDSFEEFVGEARAAHAQSLDAMREMLAAIEAQEAEAARLREEREAQAKRDAASAAERAEAERQAREAQEAEVARLAAKRAEIERQQAEIERQQAEIERQQAENERQAAELRARQEEAARNEDADRSAETAAATAADAECAADPIPGPTAKRESRPGDDEIIATLALHYRVHELKVIEWLLDMDLDAASARAAANL